MLHCERYCICCAWTSITDTSSTTASANSSLSLSLARTQTNKQCKQRYDYFSSKNATQKNTDEELRLQIVRCFYQCTRKFIACNYHCCCMLELPNFFDHRWLSLKRACACLYVHACEDVCVYEREREREREMCNKASPPSGEGSGPVQGLTLKTALAEEERTCHRQARGCTQVRVRA